MRIRILLRSVAISLMLFTGSMFAQLSFSISQLSQCFNVSNIATAVVTATPAGAVNYSWTISTGISLCTIGNTISTVGTGTAIFAFGCCGNYSITCSAYNSNNVLITATSIPVSFICVANITAASNPVMVCPGGSATLTASGANTYSWSSGPTGSTTPVTPTGPSVYTVTGTFANGCSNTKTVSVNVYTPNVQVSPNPTVCNGGTITLSASGATSYTWNGTSPFPSISVSPPVTTSYTLAATSNSAGLNCVTTKTVIVYVISNPSIAAVAVATNVCAGGQASLVATGASNYTWSTSQQGSLVVTTVPSGTNSVTYTVVGSVGTCASNTTSVMVTVMALPNVSIVPSNTAVCVGETATLTATGAQSYTWFNNLTTTSITLTPVGGTNYSVTGLSGPCQNVANFTMAVNPLPVITIASTNSLICSGKTATLTASGAQSYTWSNNAVATSITLTPVNGTYTLTGLDANGCKNTAGYTMSVNPSPTITATSSTTKICKGEKVTLTPVGGVTYTWSPVSGSGTLLVTPTVQTQYTLTGADNLGCTGTATLMVSVQACLDLGAVEAGISLNVFPSPASSEIIIESGGEADACIYNSLGQIIMQQKISEGKNQIDLTKEVSGVYFVVVNQNNKTKTIKILKE